MHDRRLVLTLDSDQLSDDILQFSDLKYYCTFACNDDLEAIGKKPGLCDTTSAQSIGYPSDALLRST